MTLHTNAVALAAVIQHSFLMLERSLREGIAFAQEHGAHEAVAIQKAALKKVRLAHRKAEEAVSGVEAEIGQPLLRSGGNDKPPPPPPGDE